MSSGAVSAGTWRSGAWRLAGERELFEHARPALEEAAEGTALPAEARRGVRTLGAFTAYFKGSPLAPRPALRHALRRFLGFSEVPRLQEHANLCWLRAHGFLAPRPLLAGVRERAGLPRYQFLLTELLPDAPDLAQLFPRAAPAVRAELLDALARDLAALHALGFVHRDLFPRNLLACVTPAGRRCAFVDAWRGGPRRGVRRPEHDLGCLFLDGATSFTGDEQALFLGSYRAESLRRGRPLDPKWSVRVERARAAVSRSERRRRPECAVTWNFPRGT